MPPSKVLHIDLLGGDAKRLKEAVEARDSPMVVVLPYRMPVADATSLLKAAGLWFLNE